MLWCCIQLPSLPPEGQRATLESLCLWAQQWSSEVAARALGEDPCDAGAALWLELARSQRLFGEPARLLPTLRAGLAALGLAGRLGLAPTPRAAALLAHSGGIARDGDELRARLAPLPLARLALPSQHLDALVASGLATIGEVLALPDAALGQRIGPASMLYLQRLAGRAHEPLALYRAPPRFALRCELPGPVHDAMALLFPLQRLLAALQGWLRGLDRAVQRCTLRLEHHRRPPTTVVLGSSAPGRDATHWLSLARERLPSLALPAPVLALGLEAGELLEPQVLQLDGWSSAAQEAGALRQLVDRLAARLGEGRVCRLQALPDHRPERAWRMQPAQQPAQQAASPARPDGDAAGAAPRPCWLLREPRPIDAPGQLLAGPERIESGWWEGADVARDYFLARDADGARLWVYRDLRGGQWHVQGYWA